MRDKTNEDPKKNAVESNGLSSDFPKPQAIQLQEGTLMVMEDALEERSSNNRRVNKMNLPASEERRKNNRRREDKEEKG